MNSVKEKLVELIGKARKEAAKKCRSFFRAKIVQIKMITIQCAEIPT